MNSDAEIKVWDLGVRGFHWLLVMAFTVAYFTDEDWRTVHIWAGYLVFALVCLRILWGFIGTRHARFTDFVYSPGATLRYVKDVLTARARRYIGHNPAGGAMIVLLLICLLITTISGVALYGANSWEGPLAWLMRGTSDGGIEQLEDLHEFAADFTVFLIVLHVIGVVWESLLHRENLVRAMLTGRKRTPEET